MGSEHLRTITKETFGQWVNNTSQPVLVDFWAPWCGPCRMLTPIIEQLAGEFEGRAIIGKVNVDEEPELSSAYGIASIPTIIVFNGGKQVEKLVGVRNEHELANLLEKYIVKF